MDPLSITAGILAILNAGGKVGRFLQRIVSLKDAPDTLLALNNEINEIRTAVEEIHDLLRRYIETAVIRDPPLTVIQSLEQTKSTVVSVERFICYELTTIEAERPRVDRSKWLRASEEIQNMKNKLQSEKTTLSLSIGVLAS